MITTIFFFLLLYVHLYLYIPIFTYECYSIFGQQTSQRLLLVRTKEFMYSFSFYYSRLLINKKNNLFSWICVTRDWSVIHCCCCVGRLLILINRMVITFCPLRLLKQQYWLDQRVFLCMLTQAHYIGDLLSLVAVVLNMHKEWWRRNTKTIFL